MKIAIITARGGSKRIPRKNIRDFCGRPMIAYAITAAQESGLFDRIIVSTEDDEIASIARQWGAEVPFRRPVSLADDYTGTIKIVAHAIQVLIEQNCKPEWICCIYPTVPLLQPEDLKQAFQLLIATGATYAFPVAEFSPPIQGAFRRCSNGELEFFYPEYQAKRTQELEPAYYDAGQFYWGKVEAWLAERSMAQNSIGYIIPRWRAVDIDTLEDWEQAELLYQALQLSRKSESSDASRVSS